MTPKIPDDRARDLRLAALLGGLTLVGLFVPYWLGALAVGTWLAGR